MAGKLILAIDQGTTGTTALIVDDKLKVRAKANREFRQVFPKPGQVEHEASAIWESVEASVGAALQASSVAPSEIAAIGINNRKRMQRSRLRLAAAALFHVLTPQLIAPDFEVP